MFRVGEFVDAVKDVLAEFGRSGKMRDPLLNPLLDRVFHLEVPAALGAFLHVLIESETIDAFQASVNGGGDERSKLFAIHGASENENSSNGCRTMSPAVPIHTIESPTRTREEQERYNLHLCAGSCKTANRYRTLPMHSL